MSLGGGIPGLSAVYIRDEMAMMAAAVLYFFPHWNAVWTKTEVRVHVTENEDLVIPRPQPHDDPIMRDAWSHQGARL